ncbi:MAG: hypothetical protein RL456_1633 [Pseudomonadota bacterium]|jgi:RimJ/RimL family protein N-acetyltransferase
MQMRRDPVAAAATPAGPMPITFAVRGGLGIRPIRPGPDAAFLHDWLSRDYARFWGMQGKTQAEVAEKYREATEDEGRHFHIVTQGADARPVALFEVYHPAADPLGRHYAVQPTDRAFHLVVAPPERRPHGVSGLAFLVLRAIASFVFADASVRRLVAEPDIRNDAMFMLCARAGFRLDRVMHLPHKTAQLIVLDRAGHQALGWQPVASAALPGHRAGAVRFHMLVGRIGRKVGLLDRGW